MRELAALIAIAVILITPACAPSYAKSYTITFHDVPCLKPHTGYHYMTCHPITVTINDLNLIVPKDFDTDLASIPRWLWSIIAPARSDFISPSILHDYLYTCHNGFNRNEIDKIFFNTLVDNDVSRFRALEMYAAVRVFGAAHFNEEGSCGERLAKLAERYGECETQKDIKMS